MNMIKGVLMENGDQVKISGIYAHNDSYSSVVGEVCTYLKPAKREDRHHVKCSSAGIWIVRDVDMHPVRDYATNQKAKQLLEADLS